MKNLFILLLILLSVKLSAQTFVTTQIAKSKIGSMSFELGVQQTQIKIKGKKIVIVYGEETIILKTKKKFDVTSLDIITYLIDGLYYDVKKNDFGIKKIELIPNDYEETLFGIVTITEDGDATHYNHLSIQ